MPMLCLAGTFRILSTEPDGDSIRFYADDPAAWARVPGPNAVRTNAGGGAQLRLDGIDALETHYSPRGGGPLHQPIDLAHQARDELLRWLGFRGVQRTGETVDAATPEQLPGYLLTRGADVYGRCVALVGRGEAPAPSGAQTMVKVADLRKTANHRLIAAGLAYPTFYLKLFPDLRAELAKQARQARDAAKGCGPATATARASTSRASRRSPTTRSCSPSSSGASSTTSISTATTRRSPASRPTSPSAPTRSSSSPLGTTRASTSSSTSAGRSCG